MMLGKPDIFEETLLEIDKDIQIKNNKEKKP